MKSGLFFHLHTASGNLTKAIRIRPEPQAPLLAEASHHVKIVVFFFAEFTIEQNDISLLPARFPHYRVCAPLCERSLTFSFESLSCHEMGNLDYKAGASVGPQNRVRWSVRKLHKSIEERLPQELALVWPVGVTSAINTGCSIDA